MTKREIKIIHELSELFLDKIIGKLSSKLENEDEKSGAWLLLSYQFTNAYPLIKELLKNYDYKLVSS